MKDGGMMIRLIDVVLILLFGFISISEVSDKSEIVLPSSKNTPLQPPTREEIIVVGVSQDGKYRLRNGRIEIESAEQLERYLDKLHKQAEEQGGNFRVRVRPHKDTPIRYTMIISAICDKLNIPKGLDVRKIKDDEAANQ